MALSTTAVDAFVAAARMQTPAYADYLAVAAELKRAPASSGRPQLRIAVLRNFTVEPLLAVVAGEALCAGVEPVFYIGGFDDAAADALDPASAFHAFAPQVVILALWPETLSGALTTRFLATSSDERAAEVGRVRAGVREIAAAIRRVHDVPVLLNNWPLPAYPTLGILDAQSTAHQTQTFVAINTGLLADATAQGGVFIVDWMRLFATLGRVACVDERYWQIGRAPLAHAALVPLGREYGKFLRALRGQSKKCLVLDCDNTLWGGVVGEDGVAGIALGSGHPGSSFADFQTEIANLHDRGVILALCSKNDEAAVLEVVRTHPGMVLRERHFAAREINWDDKVTNLRRIAATLGIGLDSLVFVDDSPFEIEFVRTALPEVTTIALPPGGVANYRNILAAGGLFDSLAYTDEDRRKTALYAHERERTALAQAAGSLSEYLTKLDIRADVHPARDVDVARVAQLSQKSNQFNLTTQRYTESEIRTLARDAQATVLVLRLADRVADLGLVGAAIVRYARGAAEIEALFVSCRALGRGAEDAFLSAVVRAAWDRPDVATISGTFRPTEKNAIAAPFYTRCGFHAAGESAGTLRFALDRHAASAVPLAPAWIHLVTGAPAHAV